jgi:hypothetical protein
VWFRQEGLAIADEGYKQEDGWGLPAFPAALSPGCPAGGPGLNHRPGGARPRRARYPAMATATGRVPTVIRAVTFWVAVLTSMTWPA